MSDTTHFARQGFKPGDVLVCTSIKIGAPANILGKAVVLDSSYMFWEPCLHVDQNDCHFFTGEGTKWRFATVSDVARTVVTISESLYGETDADMGLFTKDTGKTVADLLRDGVSLKSRAHQEA